MAFGPQKKRRSLQVSRVVMTAMKTIAQISNIPVEDRRPRLSFVRSDRGCRKNPRRARGAMSNGRFHRTPIDDIANSHVDTNNIALANAIAIRDGRSSDRMYAVIASARTDVLRRTRRSTRS